MKKITLFCAALLVSSSLITPAFAQVDNSEAGARMEKLERDIMLLQRQLSRGGIPAGGDSAGGDAQAEVRISGLEEQIRQLRGQVEEAQFQNRKLTENLDKLQRDSDFRFNEITRGGASAAPAPAPAAAAAPAAAPAGDKPQIIKSDGTKTTAGDGTLKADADTGANDEGDSPRDHYNYAFRLLNQTQYDKAAAAFESFVKKYPKDPLVGNAYYWMGETFYIRRDYVNAADSFRQGFEELPTGPKAPDNLLKLAMALDALNRDKEACVVLGQVVTKFKKTSAAVTQKAQQEQKRINCQ